MSDSGSPAQAKWKDRCLFLGGLYVGEVIPWGASTGKWRAWFMSESDGAHLAWCETEDAAKREVEAALAAALAPSQLEG